MLMAMNSVLPPVALSTPRLCMTLQVSTQVHQDYLSTSYVAKAILGHMVLPIIISQPP